MTYVNTGDFGSFIPRTEVCVDPMELLAIGLLLGQEKFAKCQAEAKARGIQEQAIIGNHAVYVALRPPPEMRPPEGWLHEFVKPKYLARAKAMIEEWYPGRMSADDADAEFTKLGLH